MDMRGHGQSAVNKAADFSVLAGDVVGLLDHLGIDRTHFIGLSIGGMIGQQMAISHGDRLKALVLCDTTSAIPPENAPMFEQRAATARAQGMQPLVEPTVERWFTAGYLNDHADRVKPVADMVAATPVEGYAHGCEAIIKLNMTAQLSSITTPTLVVVGADDPGTPVAASRVIHEAISGSELCVIDDASHFCNWQQPAVFNEAVTGFLARH
jgi:3-oxoadipate enol-lactonase